jgi:hypothetical protein
MGGLVVTYSTMDPRFAADVNGFLRVIKIHSTTSFRSEVKPGVPCHSFMRVKEPFTYDMRSVKVKLDAICCPQSSLL